VSSSKSDVISWAIGKGANNWRDIITVAIKYDLQDIFNITIQHVNDLGLISYLIGYYNNANLLYKQFLYLYLASSKDDSAARTTKSKLSI
jgi:hypothetical protein